MHHHSTQPRTRWRRTAALLSTWAVALGAAGAVALVATPAAASPTGVLVGGFEDESEPWNLSSWGDDLASASYERAADGAAPEGTQIATVTMSVGSDEDENPNEAWAEFFRDVSDLEFEALSFAINAPGMNNIVVRLYDAYGETISTGYALDADAGWQTITVTDPPAGHAWTGSWGGSEGNTAGALDHPITRIGFVLESGLRADQENPEIAVRFDDVRIVEPVELPPPSDEGILIGGFQSDIASWATWGWTSEGGTVDFGHEALEDDSAPEGTHIAEVSLDASSATNPRAAFAEFHRSLPGLDIAGFSFSIKAPGLNGVNLRLYDYYEELYQLWIPLEDTDEWQHITAPAPNPDDYTYWGGSAADTPGVWEGPANRVGIVLATEASRDPEATAVSAQFDNIRVVTPPSDLTLTSVELGNVFVGSTPAQIAYETSAESLSWTLRDAAGAVVRTGNVASAAASGTIDLDIARGWYSLTVLAHAGDAVVATASTTLARIPTASPSADNPFGVAAHYGGGWWELDSIPLISAAGIGTIRDEVYWSALETTAGEYNWGITEWTQPVVDSGLEMMLIPGYGNALYGGDGPTTPEAIAAYSAYAAALAERFEDDLAAIEIWNEWEITIGETTVVSPDTYVALLEEASAAVKAATPDVKVIGPAMVFLTSNWQDTGITWLEHTFKLGALEHIDGVVLHAYSYPRSAEELDSSLAMVDELIREYNDGEPIPMWVTEHGWPTGTDARGIPEATQANNLTKAAAIGVKHGLERYVWYDFANDGTDDAYTEHNFGLIHHHNDSLGAFTPKPGYVAYANATAMLDGATFVEQGELGDHIWDLAYDTDTGDSVDAPDLRVLWATEDTAVGIQSEVPFTVTTQYGVATQYDATGGGVVILPLTNEPVYLSGAIERVTIDGSSLTISEAYVGQPMLVQWAADNTAGESAQEFVLTVEGRDEPVVQTVPAGEVGTVEFEMPAPSATGTVRVTGAVSVGGHARGVVSATTQVGEALALTGSHTLDENGQHGLRIRLVNRSSSAVSVEGLSWSAGSASGSAWDGETLAGNSTLILDVPLDEITAPSTWTAVARIEGRANLIASGTLLPVGEVTDAAHQTIVIDGVLDDLEDAPSVFITDGGEADLDATVWYTWDEDALYLSARVVDDVHYQQATGGNVWQGDSLQIGVTGGGPGEILTGHQEIGIALTPDGPQVYRWLPNTSPGFLPGAVAAVSRDDDAGVTMYEVALPWSSIGGWNPLDGLFASAIVINDNDNDGRSWVEWGSGIATAKDPSLFNAIRALPADDDPTDPTDPTDPSGPTDPDDSTGPSDPSDGLPESGANVIVLTVIAVALMALGVIMVVRRNNALT